MDYIPETTKVSQATNHPNDFPKTGGTQAAQGS